jgi:hypothetical protein
MATLGDFGRRRSDKPVVRCKVAFAARRTHLLGAYAERLARRKADWRGRIGNFERRFQPTSSKIVTLAPSSASHHRPSPKCRTSCPCGLPHLSQPPNRGAKRAQNQRKLNCIDRPIPSFHP